MGSLGPFEIVLIFLAILLIFGAKRIPEIARGLGRGIREFKDATTEIKKELNVNLNDNRIQAPQQGTTAPRMDTAQQTPQPAPPSSEETQPS